MIQLVYASVAVVPLSEEDLGAMAAISARNNAALGLTGLLVHQGRCFGGVLEGPQRVVFARMEAIAIDPRHAEVQILREEPIQRRRFDNWSFALVPAPDEDGEEGDDADAFIRLLAHRLT